MWADHKEGQDLFPVPNQNIKRQKILTVTIPFSSRILLYVFVLWSLGKKMEAVSESYKGIFESESYSLRVFHRAWICHQE